MSLIEKIKNFFKNFNKKAPQLEEPQNINPENNQVQSNSFREDLKISEEKSFKEKLQEILNVEEGKQISVSFDFEKIIIGAYMEDQGASKELLDLYKRSKVNNTDAKHLDSSVRGEVDTFFIPSYDQNK